MNLKGLSDDAKLWWQSKAIAEGYTYRGRASVIQLMMAIAKGEYIVIKKTLDTTI